MFKEKHGIFFYYTKIGVSILNTFSKTKGLELCLCLIIVSFLAHERPQDTAQT